MLYVPSEYQGFEETPLPLPVLPLPKTDCCGGGAGLS